MISAQGFRHCRRGWFEGDFDWVPTGEVNLAIERQIYVVLLGALLGFAAGACDDPTIASGPLVASSAPDAVFGDNDSQPPIVAANPPPPVTGGGLLVTRDGKLAVAADAARSRISVVDIERRTVLRTIALEPGSRPGRLTEDAAEQIHIVLMGSAEVITLDRHGNTSMRRAVCEEPRGLAHDLQRERLLLACRDGRIQGLPVNGGQVDTITQLLPDLRDVVVVESGGASRVFVSRFREATLTELDTSGAIVAGTELPDVQLAMPAFVEGPMPKSVPPRATELVPFVARVAWRVQNVGDGVAVLHQRAMQYPVSLDADQAGYGHESGCARVVRSSLSLVDGQGNVLTTAGLPGAQLPVDMAASPDGHWWALADAGTTLATDHASGVGSVQLYRAGDFAFGQGRAFEDLCDRGLVTTVSSHTGQQAVAVAFNPQRDRQLVALTRQPASLLILDDVSQPHEVGFVDLGGDDITDTGHDLFHRVAGSLACAHCHPAGTDDGHVWQFRELGPRRTQTLEGGPRAPFHWAGELSNLEELMSEVFVGRMHGEPQSAAHVAALQAWLSSLPPARGAATGSAEVRRGRELFESARVGCATCHAGKRLSDGKLHRVGTSAAALKTPSLRGVSKRLPLMHDGCATTLRQRFDRRCGGGDEHGVTSHLDAEQIDALVSYLETL